MFLKLRILKMHYAAENLITPLPQIVGEIFKFFGHTLFGHSDFFYVCTYFLGVWYANNYLNQTHNIDELFFEEFLKISGDTYVWFFEKSYIWFTKFNHRKYYVKKIKLKAQHCSTGAKYFSMPL